MISGDQRRAVRRIAAARMISLVGSGAAFAALAYIVYHLTGESTAHHDSATTNLIDWYRDNR